MPSRTRRATLAAAAAGLGALAGCSDGESDGRDASDGDAAADGDPTAAETTGAETEEPTTSDPTSTLTPPGGDEETTTEGTAAPRGQAGCSGDGSGDGGDAFVPCRLAE